MADALFETYRRATLSFEEGEGVWLKGSDGRRYMDLGAGIAVTSLGHAHPHLVEAMTKAVAGVWHTSNLFEIPGQKRLAERLVEETFADRVFFCNSGAEANECALKTARRYHYVRGEPHRTRIITMEGAFHGRTLGTIAAGGSPKYLEGFGTPLEGFDQVPFGDIEAVRAAVGPQTAAILVEPVQGEAGIFSLDPAALKALREVCDENGLLLIFDEVQTGVGRLGTLFAYQSAGVTPDILSSAKGLGGGFPIGACLATEAAAAGMQPGTHGTTFGGNALAAAAGNAVLDVVLEPGFLESVKRKGLVAKQAFAAVVDAHPHVFDLVRGEGLMLGLKCKVPVGDVVTAAREHGAILIPAGDNVARLLPPLVITEAQIGEAAERVSQAAASLSPTDRESVPA